MSAFVQSFHQLWHNPAVRKIFWFGAVGGTATITYIGINWGLHQILNVNIYTANIMAFCCSSPVSYFGHRWFTFASKTQHATSVPRFALQLLAAFLISKVVLYLSTQGFLRYEFALLINAVLIPAMSFFVYQFWVFTHKTAE